MARTREHRSAVGRAALPAIAVPAALALAAACALQMVANAAEQLSQDADASTSVVYYAAGLLLPAMLLVVATVLLLVADAAADDAGLRRAAAALILGVAVVIAVLCVAGFLASFKLEGTAGLRIEWSVRSRFLVIATVAVVAALLANASRETVHRR